MMNSPTYHTRRRAGMTLIEVMVALSLLGTMGLLVYSGLGITIRSQRRGETIQERYHAARITLGRMKRELSMAFVSLHQAEDQRTQTLFDGADDAITFITSSHEPWQRNAHESDQMEIEYRVESVEGGRALIRRVKHYVDDRPGRGGKEEVVVLGVRDIEFEYYDKEREDWQDDWDVLIEDAIERREQMRLLQQYREMAEEVRTSEESGIAGIAVAAAADKELAMLEGETMDQLLLPNRVRIRLELEDEEDTIYVLETQAEIFMTDPLWY